MNAHDQNTQQQENGQLLAGAMEQWEERNAPITADLRDVHCAVQSSRPHCY